MFEVDKDKLHRHLARLIDNWVEINNSTEEVYTYEVVDLLVQLAEKVEHDDFAPENGWISK